MDREITGPSPPPHSTGIAGELGFGSSRPSRRRAQLQRAEGEEEVKRGLGMNSEKLKQVHIQTSLTVALTKILTKVSKVPN
jgi:hypothetical protein